MGHFGWIGRALSSVVERHIDIVKVVGPIPTGRTIMPEVRRMIGTGA